MIQCKHLQETSYVVADADEGSAASHLIEELTLSSQRWVITPCVQ